MLDPDTATPTNSIWDDIDRNQFEQNADDLEALKYRAAPWAQARSEWPEDDKRYSIPYAVERQLADDFAYISACEPKVVTVTAATVEAYENPPGIIIRLAGNKGIREYVQHALGQILRNVEQCARKGRAYHQHIDLADYANYQPEISQQKCADKCLEIVVQLNMNRLFKRIGSHHFEKPKHLALYAKGPISPQWSKLMSNPVQKKQDAVNLAAEAEEFNTVFDRLENVESEEGKVNALVDLVKRCFSFTIDGRSLQERLEKAGYGKKTFSSRPFREINKTAAYWRICCNLATFARSHSKYFLSSTLVPIQHYNPSTRPGMEAERFIHAEVQVITYYEIANLPLWPRALGTSKKACFLCYEFIRCHGCLKVSKSHGIVFSRWAVPDRKDYSPETLARLRKAMQGIDGRVTEELEKIGIGRIKQDDPVQSSIDLNYFSLPIDSGTSLQSARNSTSTLAPGDPSVHDPVSVDIDQGTAAKDIGLVQSFPQPDQHPTTKNKCFFGCLKPILGFLKISGGNDMKEDKEED
ncbi:hypothetical protein E2P81_ATG04508 [Venturia nashicola]|uniref:Uncharacterized protein n=1 Tax=Venturia nashicola TaxID=86259 RepID=A0A4Z1PDM9_9PEZI|nr:hypothetical protein E6O75_ATG04614 [Venturia nashicola]TLD37696.1 hypothetical protein E2P81_ATG04508 [Venturia nashicola]